jgi:hypothetical protein
MDLHIKRKTHTVLFGGCMHFDAFLGFQSCAGSEDGLALASTMKLIGDVEVHFWSQLIFIDPNTDLVFADVESAGLALPYS